MTYKKKKNPLTPPSSSTLFNMEVTSQNSGMAENLKLPSKKDKVVPPPLDPPLFFIYLY